MAPRVRVEVVLVISDGDVNARSADDCHFTTLPVCPDNEIASGVAPIHMACDADRLPATVDGFTVNDVVLPLVKVVVQPLMVAESMVILYVPGG